MHICKFNRVLLSVFAAAIAVGMSNSYVAARGPTTAPAKQPGTIRVVLAGDSTVTATGGWAPGFTDALTGKIECINEASGGQSTKTFAEQGVWDICMHMHPDYVLIQFGHNDGPGKGPKRETDPQTTYFGFLKHFVDDARAKGAKPILVTSIARREWGKDGKIHSTLIPYVDAMKRLATEDNVPLIDLHSESIAIYEKLGREAVDKLAAKNATDPTKVDGTHLNHDGGELFGTLVATDLVKLEPELANYVKSPSDKAKAQQVSSN